jgi:tetraacyldisaccharide 4'-kinase
MSTRRPFLLPLVPLYAAGLALKRQATRWGLLGQKYLDNPVISVGSLSAGGAGKTPVVLMLAAMLEKGGFAVRILTRGYRRLSKGVERVDPQGDPGWYGDEPVMLAQRVGSGGEVFVGADRQEAGLLAEKGDASGRTIVHLLDDGFQHERLARDIDVVLLTQQDLEDKLLPAGDLREPLNALRYADVIVLREEELGATRKFLTELTRDISQKPSIWVIRRRLMLTGGREFPKRPLAFSGIARPDGFVAMLKAERCNPVATVMYGDHHGYTDKDISRLVKIAGTSGAKGFVTTEKDAVKLSPAMRERLETVGPLVILRLRLELLDEKAKMTEIIARVGRMDRRIDWRTARRGRRI